MDTSIDRADVDDSLLDRTLATIRRAVLRLGQAGTLTGFVVLHSLAGGTGSGFGSRLVTSLRDIYGGKRYILSVAILPFFQGSADVVVQHYNVALALAQLQASADAVLLFSNDAVARTLSGGAEAATRKGAATASYSLEELNAAIARTLAGLMLPVTVAWDAERAHDELGLSLTPDQVVARVPFDLGALVTAVAPSPNRKILHAHSSAAAPVGRGTTGKRSRGHAALAVASDQWSLQTWEGVAKRLERGLPRYGPIRTEEAIETEAAMLYVGGDTDGAWLAGDDAAALDRLDRRLSHGCELDVCVSRGTGLGAVGHARSLTLVTNDSSVADEVGHVLNRGRRLLEVGAYVHHYTRFGLAEDDLVTAFETLECIVDDYSATVFF